MRPKDRAIYSELMQGIDAYDKPLPGLCTNSRKDCLVRQMIDSIHRIGYVKALLQRAVKVEWMDPGKMWFNPLKAAIAHKSAGNIDEAWWLIFLSTHFGFVPSQGWTLTREIYAGDGDGPWTWNRVCSDRAGFRGWLSRYLSNLVAKGQRRRFGNHRKYESLRPSSRRGTALVVESYIRWVGANRGHAKLVADCCIGMSEEQTFAALYKSMDVLSFGRTAKFDFLTMAAKVGLVDMRPASPYLRGATGPVAGAMLLFGRMDISRLEAAVIELGKWLGMGMQIMEDSLCNWQKSPTRYNQFSG